MSESLKVLSQHDLSATTLTDVYTVPVNTNAALSSIVVTNRNGASRTFRVAIAVAGAADDPKQYVVYDETLAANAHVVLDVGAALAAADVVRVYASAVGVSVNVFGTEVT